MGGVLLLTLINETTDWLQVLFDVLFRSCSGIRNFESAGALDWSHCWKSVDIVVVMAFYDKNYDLIGKLGSYVTSLSGFPLDS